GAGGARGERRAGGGQRRQRDAAAGGERAHQHLPALAGALASANDMVERDDDAFALVRTVLEKLHRGQVAAADLDAGEIGRNERDGDAEVFLLAEQMVGVVELESEAEE